MTGAGEQKKFFQEFFPWQYPQKLEESWERGFVYDEAKYWGGFPRAFDPAAYRLPNWAIGPFERSAHNPVLAPGPDAWDAGHFGGGVHNGSVIQKDGLFYYVYRGEREIPPINGVDYLCKIGIAVSRDGVHFEKLRDHNPLFHPEDMYSYEDVSLVEHDGTYFLFCNRWDWANHSNPAISGCWLATSTDLLHWEERGIVFPDAKRTHRNGVVLQNPHNQAVRVNGKFVMYINDYLMAYSDDLLHWESKEIEGRWPGGEGCFALADYREKDPDTILLFTGGHHSGHFYAVGEVRFAKSDPETPLEWLPRPILTADPTIRHESGYSATEPGRKVSFFRDCIFFNGLTRHQDRWLIYYGGSEYYTCLGFAPVRRGP
jgi:predicted GH43/DUF377 family glycosyl hydrolase